MNKNSKLGFDLIANSVDEAQPLLYRITVVPAPGADLLTIYVGQTINGSKRPFERYDANVRNMLEGKRPLNGKGFRPVHHDLRAAHQAGHKICIELVRNVDLTAEDILSAERQLQARYGVEPVGRTELRVLQDDGAPI
ncbi:hypothetical protein ACI48D_08800 [Massilia sp. LXY-6]|uniref:hypothetical protein n=1 Tax=Massilia sp. LXY-6 TaxID=3379823 RepID=UPI003EE21177